MRIEFAPEVELGGERFGASVLWTPSEGRWPKRGGRFPTDHPCFAADAGFRAFRDLGYQIGLYSEGDGFSIGWTGLPAEQVAYDLERCFGWIVANPTNLPADCVRRASA